MNKLKILIISTILLLTSLAFAQAWWTANANVFVSRTQVQGQVYNGMPRSIYCVGRVVGNTHYGSTLWSNFEAVIPPGNTAYAYV